MNRCARSPTSWRRLPATATNYGPRLLCSGSAGRNSTCLLNWRRRHAPVRASTTTTATTRCEICWRPFWTPACLPTGTRGTSTAAVPTCVTRTRWMPRVWCSVSVCAPPSSSASVWAARCPTRSTNTCPAASAACWMRWAGNVNPEYATWRNYMAAKRAFQGP